MASTKKVTSKTKKETLDDSFESCRYNERMKILNKQYERLRSNKNAWKQELKERQVLEGTLMDGLIDM